MNTKVEQMTNDKGRPVANHFIITTPQGTYFQSYRSIIARKPFGVPTFPTNNPDMKIELDEHYWDYSKTTGKYRNQFLGEGIAETRRKIKDGTYILTNLND